MSSLPYRITCKYLFTRHVTVDFNSSMQTNEIESFRNEALPGMDVLQHLSVITDQK